MSLESRLRKLEERFRQTVKKCLHPFRFRMFHRTECGEEITEVESPEITCDVCGQKCGITHNFETVIQKWNPKTKQIETIPFKKAS